jgi:hypothetical protein
VRLRQKTARNNSCSTRLAQGRGEFVTKVLVDLVAGAAGSISR